jgi:hypothetical protein
MSPYCLWSQAKTPINSFGISSDFNPNQLKNTKPYLVTLITGVHPLEPNQLLDEHEESYTHPFDEIPTDSTPWNSLLPMLKLDAMASPSSLLPGAYRRLWTALGEPPSHTVLVGSIAINFHASEHRPTLCRWAHAASHGAPPCSVPQHHHHSILLLHTSLSWAIHILINSSD